MRGAHPFERLAAAVREAAALGSGETFVVAASGGPDSTALAALLAEAASAAGARLILGHVNHGARPSAAQDEALVLALGAALQARVTTCVVPAGPTDEARLRRERYAALTGMARTAGARRVFAAHHAEDQTETVLLALFRGAGPSGLGGMARERPLSPEVTLVRPLLGFEPRTLREYCWQRQLPFALDPTNVARHYRRNALRAALAELRPHFPHLDAAVARGAAILREEREGTPRARLRAQLRAELAEADRCDVTFERLDSAARALERAGGRRHFLRRGVEVIVE